MTRYVFLLVCLLSCAWADTRAQGCMPASWNISGKAIFDSISASFSPRLRDKTELIKHCVKYGDSLNDIYKDERKVIALSEYLDRKFSSHALHNFLRCRLVDRWLNYALNQVDRQSEESRRGIAIARYLIDNADTISTKLNLKWYYVNVEYHMQFRNYITALAYADSCEYIIESSSVYTNKYAGLAVYNKGKIYTYLKMDREAMEYLKKSLLYYEHQKRFHLAISAAGRICKYMIQNGYSDAEVEYYHNLFSKVYPAKSLEAGNNQNAVKCRMYHFEMDYLSAKGRYEEAMACERKYFYYLDKVLSYMDYPEKQQYDVGDVFDMSFRIPLYKDLKYYDSVDYVYEKFISPDSVRNAYPGECGDLFRELGTFYRERKNYERAVECYWRACDYYHMWRDSTDGFDALVAAAESSIGAVNFQYAQRCLDSAANILPNYEKFPSYRLVNYYQVLAYVSFKLGNKDLFEYNFSNACDLCMKLITSQFGYNMLETELINNIGKYTTRALVAAYSIPDISDSLKVKILNMQLMQNNISFVSQKAILNNLGEGSLLHKMYNQIVLMKHLYTDKYLLPLQRDSIHAKISDMEQYIASQSDAFKYFRTKISTDFDAIRRNLWDGSLAVEFVKIFDYDDEILSLIPQEHAYPYFAFVFDNKSEAPQIVKLFSQKRLDTYIYHNSEKMYSDTMFTKMVWGKILDRFPGATRLFFSPTGDFHRIATEYLSLGGGLCMADKYKVVRLSSCANISELESLTEVGNNILVVSDIDYDLSISDMEKTADKYFPRGQGGRYCYRTRHVENFRRLPATREESDYVVYNSAGRQVQSLLGGNATEEAVKHYLSSPQSVVHIATHGYTKFIVDEVSQTSSELLSGAGLIMAGANNHAAYNINVPDYIDDGYLTAKEIAELKLDDNQLVVLSACETGLGHVDANGLFGLMRGFKLAGAKTLLMSLGPISDEATSLFMRKFYKSLFSGSSPRQSLIAAQSYMRSGSRFNNPFYWANYVIVD